MDINRSIKILIISLGVLFSLYLVLHLFDTYGNTCSLTTSRGDAPTTSSRGDAPTTSSRGGKRGEQSTGVVSRVQEWGAELRNQESVSQVDTATTNTVRSDNKDVAFSPQTGSEEKVRKDSKPKIMNILYWIGKYSPKNEDPEQLKRRGCKVTNCRFTSNASAVDAMEWDAIILNTRLKGLYEALGHKRNSKTYWIFYSQEPPFPTNDKHYKGIKFNMSMTWRRDSDILIPYYIFSKRDRPVESSNVVNYAAGKTGKVAWLVSHCETNGQREKLVESLERYIHVDIFGRCGNGGRCEKMNCASKIGPKYKFYLSFENQLCDDYITEKLFRPYTENMIPVVYGLGYEEYNLPPHSYIDVLDFPNVKKLADYLNYLNKNDTAYNEYFIWKNSYRVNYETSRTCEMCEFLQKANDFNSDPNVKGNFKEKKGPVITPKNEPFKIHMPNEEDSLKHIQVNGSQLRILDFKKWFDAVCLNPNNDKNLHNFITGQ